MSNGDFKVQVGIGANTDELQAGMEEAKSQVQDGVEQIKASLDSMSSQTQGVASEMAGSLGSLRDSLNSLGGAAGAVAPQLGRLAGEFASLLGAAALMKTSVSSTQEWASQVNRLSQMLGISTEEASALNLALGELAASSLRSDATTESLDSNIAGFTRSLKQNEEGLNAAGIATRTASGEYRNLLDILLDTIKYLNSLEGATAQNVAMTALFKQGAEEVRPILGLNEQALETARKKAEELGLVLGRDAVMHARAFQAAGHELQLAWESFKEYISGPLVDALNKLLDWLSRASQSIREFMSLSKQTEADWAKIGEGGWFARWGMGGKPLAPEEARPSGSASPEELLPARGGGGGGGGGAGGPGLLQQWRDELEQMKLAEDNFFDFSKEKEKEFWAGKLAMSQEGSAEWLEVRRQMFELDKAIAAEELAQTKETEESKAKLAEITADKKKALALIDLDIAKDKNAHLRAMDEIDKAEELRRQQELETKKYAIELQYLREHEKIELDKVKAEIEAGTKSALELQKLEDKKKEIVAKEQAQEEELQRKHQQTMLQLQEKEKEQEQSNWDQTLNRIGSDFNNLIGKLASGQKEMLSAFKSFCDSMVKTFIDAVEQMIMQWLDFQAIMTAAKVGFKAIGGIFGFQAGAWNIPHTMPAVLHPGEMVLPAPAAAAFRSAAVGGGALGGSGGAPGSSQVIVGPVHLTIPALDGADVECVLLNNPDAVGRVLKSLGRNFIPVGR